jgi:hypothetical protein
VIVEPELPVAFERRFQTWSYTVSLQRLLLRSLRKPEDGLVTSFEVMFQAVSAMQVRSFYSELHLREATPSEIEDLRRNIERQPVGPTRFIVIGDDLRGGWVICSAVVIAENELDYVNMAELIALGGGIGLAGANG